MAQLNIKWNDQDIDIIKHLETVGPTSDYIRKLIRKDMTGEKEKDIIVSATPKDNRLDTILENLDEVYSIVKRIERSIPS